MQPVYEKAGWKNTARRCLRLPPLWHCCQTVTWRLRTEQCLTLNECMFYKIISCTAVSVWPTAPMLPPQQIRLYCISRSFGWRRASQQNQLCFVHKSSFVIQIQLGLGVAWFPNGHWVLMWLTSLKPFFKSWMRRGLVIGMCSSYLNNFGAKRMKTFCCRWRFFLLCKSCCNTVMLGESWVAFQWQTLLNLYPKLFQNDRNFLVDTFLPESTDWNASKSLLEAETFNILKKM